MMEHYLNDVVVKELNYCKITTFNCCFLCSVILHKLTHQHLPICTALDWCDLETWIIYKIKAKDTLLLNKTITQDPIWATHRYWDVDLPINIPWLSRFVDYSKVWSVFACIEIINWKIHDQAGIMKSPC